MNEEPQPPAGVAFWVAAVLGWLIIAIGIRMGLHDRELKPALLAKWLAGGLVVHDGLWLPIVALISALVAFFLRRRVPLVLGWAAGTTAVLTLIAWPFVRGYGRRADLPSALQRNYARGLIAYIAITWSIAIVVLVLGRVRRRRVGVDE